MSFWAGWSRQWNSGYAFRRAALLMLAAIALSLPWHAAPSPRVLARETATVPGVVDPFADVVPEALVPAERAADELSAIRMNVALDPAIGTIGGEMNVTWRNPASQPLEDVWFRLFPNAFYYGEGDLQVADVTVDGASVVPELALDDTALRVPLPVPVDPGESAELALTFTATVPADSTGSYGIFSRDTRNGSWVLADWYPILAVWEEGDGWALPEATPIGDPTYAPSAFYDVQVTAPEDLEVVATGVLATETKANGAVTRHFVAGPARDFVLVADDDNAPLSRQVNDTLLTLWTPPSLDPAIGVQTLETAAGALRYYNQTFGAYP